MCELSERTHSQKMTHAMKCDICTWKLKFTNFNFLYCYKFNFKLIFVSTFLTLNYYSFDLHIVQYVSGTPVKYLIIPSLFSYFSKGSKLAHKSKIDVAQIHSKLKMSRRVPYKAIFEHF